MLHDMLLALDFFSDAPREVVLVWPAGASLPEALLDVLRTAFLPNRALAGAAEGPALEALVRATPLAAGKAALGGRPTAFVCERGVCQAPAFDAATLRERLAG